MNRLTDHDKTVLDAIFNPLEPLGIHQPSGCQLVNEDNIDLSEDNTGDDLDDDAKELVKRAILLSERRQFDEALEIFEIALARYPNSPAILNDKAQTLQLAGKKQDAIENLDKAVELSRNRGKVSINALCQRGVLRKFLGDEAMARVDFEEAANNGSKFAKSQLLAMNPYAKMCNAMLQKVMTQNVRQNGSS